MGTFLSTPVTDLESESGTGELDMVYGVSAMQGWRSGMEDAHVTNPSFDSKNQLSLFAVFDGHGGPEVALFCKAHLAEVLRNTAPFKQLGRSDALAAGNRTVDTEVLEDALRRCFLELDVALSEKEGVKEMRKYARAEDRKRQLSLGNVDLEEMTEAAEACGLTLSQLRAVIATQVSERIKNKRRRGGDEEDSDGTGSECEDCEDCVGEEGSEEALEGCVVTSSDVEAGGGAAEAHDDDTGAVAGKEDSRRSESSTECGGSDGSGGEGGDAGPGTDEDATTEETLSDDSSSGKEERKAASSSSASEVENEGSPDRSGKGLDETAKAEACSGEFEDLRPHTRPGGVGVESGATAVVAVLGFDRDASGGRGGGFLTVANAGDSRCVLCRSDGRAEDMSEDHKPEDELELARVEAAGGSVVEGRIEGNLNLSRAIGDLLYKRNLSVPVEKQMISALPDLKTVRLNFSRGGTSGEGGGGSGCEGADRFIVLACDGIWNSMSSQEVVDFASHRLDRGMPPSEVCEELLDECLAPDTDGDGTGCDNMTMMIILLPGFTPANPKSPARASPSALAEAREDYASQPAGDAAGQKRHADDERTSATGETQSNKQPRSSSSSAS